MYVLLRNTYCERDYKNGVTDRGEWGPAAMTRFSSGFTPGTAGVEGFGFYALRLDGGRGRSGQGGIDFFKQDSDGRAAKDIARVGGAVNLRVSNTVLKYGEQTPVYPVLSDSYSRLLPETYTVLRSARGSSIGSISTRLTSPVRLDVLLRVKTTVSLSVSMWLGST